MKTRTPKPTVRTFEHLFHRDAAGQIHAIDFDINRAGDRVHVRKGLPRRAWFTIGVEVGRQLAAANRGGRVKPK